MRNNSSMYNVAKQFRLNLTVLYDYCNITPLHFHSYVKTWVKTVSA